MQVTLRRLEVFVAVADTGSFARAANRLNIAQPSVSAHIRGLEREVGGVVFARRRGSRPVLTDLGRSVREHARQLLAEADELRADVVNIRSAGGQRLVLSCQRSLANFALKEQITHFALTRPGIQLTVRIGRQEDVVSDVRDGLADIGCFLSNEEMRGLNSQVIGTQRLCLVAAPDHPLASQRRVTPAKIAEHEFVGPPPGSLFGRAVTRLLGGMGIRDIRFAAQATEYQFLRELVTAGVGICCSLEKNLEPDLAAGTLKKINVEGQNLMLDIRLISSQSRPHSKPMIELTEYLRSRAPKL